LWESALGSLFEFHRGRKGIQIENDRIPLVLFMIFICVACVSDFRPPAGERKYFLTARTL